MEYTYKQNFNFANELVSIQRSDGVSIPIDPANSDYQAYLNKDTLPSKLAEKPSV
jgi:hypothetical protein